MPDSKKKSDVTGEDLFRRYLDGDSDAFTELVALFENELYYYVNAIVRDSHEAKHIMIDAFANMAVSGGKFDGRASIKTYLFTIAKNLAFKYLKMRRKEQHISFDEITDVIPDNRDRPDEILDKTDNENKIHESIMELKEEYRVVLVLLYFEDMSYKEAGQIMNKSVDQISVLSHRAKAALKKRMESKGFVYT